MPSTPNNVRGLDDVDLHLLSLLQRDGRMTNKALAEAVGIAPSTCLARVSRLLEEGTILGVHAEISPTALGRSVQAMIAVRIRADLRASIREFADTLVRLPTVLDVYFVSGSFDFLVHVATPDVEGLREVIATHLSATGMVAGTDTHLIFEHRRGESPPLRPSR